MWIVTVLVAGGVLGLVMGAGCAGPPFEPSPVTELDGAGGEAPDDGVEAAPTEPAPGRTEPQIECYDSASAAHPPQTQTSAQASCTPDQVDAVKNCLDAGDLRPCASYFFADEGPDAACTSCLFGYAQKESSLTPAWLVIARRSDPWIVPNVPACEALVQGKRACGPPASDALFCAYHACKACEWGDHDQCMGHALGHAPCGPIPEECQSVLDPRTTDPFCSGADEIERLVNVAITICGGDASPAWGK